MPRTHMSRQRSCSHTSELFTEAFESVFMECLLIFKFNIQYCTNFHKCH